MRELYTDIEISSTPENVWPVLMNIDRWHEWNPFIPEISGDISLGSKLRIRMEAPGAKAMSFSSEISRLQKDRDFAWKGKLPIPGAFRGEHIFELRPLADSRTRFVHREEFTGWMLPFLWRYLNTSAKAGFQLMNEAIKKEIEKTSN